jgi:phosphohistidine phosphatase
MLLYFMQHGTQLSSLKDPEEGLAKEGIETVRKSAKALKKMGISFDQILTSTKKRALETAQIVADTFSYEGKIIQTEKLKPMTTAVETIDFLKEYENIEKIFITGHLPSILNTCAFLLGYENLKIEIIRGSCLCLELPALDKCAAMLKWYMPPDVLEMMS